MSIPASGPSPVSQQTVSAAPSHGTQAQPQLFREVNNGVLTLNNGKKYNIQVGGATPKDEEIAELIRNLMQNPEIQETFNNLDYRSLALHQEALPTLPPGSAGPPVAQTSKFHATIYEPGKDTPVSHKIFDMAPDISEMFRTSMLKITQALRYAPQLSQSSLEAKLRPAFPTTAESVVVSTAAATNIVATPVLQQLAAQPPSTSPAPPSDSGISGRIISLSPVTEPAAPTPPEPPVTTALSGAATTPSFSARTTKPIVSQAKPVLSNAYQMVFKDRDFKSLDVNHLKDLIKKFFSEKISMQERNGVLTITNANGKLIAKDDFVKALKSEVRDLETAFKILGDSSTKERLSQAKELLTIFDKAQNPKINQEKFEIPKKHKDEFMRLAEEVFGKSEDENSNIHIRAIPSGLGGNWTFAATTETEKQGAIPVSLSEIRMATRNLMNNLETALYKGGPNDELESRLISTDKLLKILELADSKNEPKDPIIRLPNTNNAFDKLSELAELKNLTIHRVDKYNCKICTADGIPLSLLELRKLQGTKDAPHLFDFLKEASDPKDDVPQLALKKSDVEKLGNTIATLGEKGVVAAGSTTKHKITAKLLSQTLKQGE